MGKTLAAFILGLVTGWLGPMCAKLPDAPAPAATSVAAPVAAPVASTTTAATETVLPAVEAPSPTNAESASPQVVLVTYRMKKMFQAVGDRYLIHVVRANRAAVAAVDVRMSLITRLKGKIVEREESAEPQTLEPESKAYAGLSASTAVIDELLVSEEAGTELEWSLSYRLEGDAPGLRRCFALRALPRRREPEGVLWRVLGASTSCAK